MQHPLEESRDCLAFATEPVYCSLANALGRWENMPQPVPKHIREYKLFDVEIKYGLLQVSRDLGIQLSNVELEYEAKAAEDFIPSNTPPGPPLHPVPL